MVELLAERRVHIGDKPRHGGPEKKPDNAL
jgi:hypothetical protein